MLGHLVKQSIYVKSINALVLIAFSNVSKLNHDEQIVGKINVFDSQSDAFQKSKSTVGYDHGQISNLQSNMDNNKIILQFCWNK